MENYTIKDQYLVNTNSKINFPVLKREEGKWYKNHNTKIDFLLNYQGQKYEHIHYGFWRR